MTSKSLPIQITSYDLLKTFAVIIMVVDHIGAYFFPDDLWWRAIGRTGFPVWFFLVGHASGRDLPRKLLLSAGVLIAANFVVGMNIFPLNALVTIIFIRLLIDPVMNFARRGPIYFWSITVLLVVAISPTYPLMEYGTLGLLTAIFGYLVRHRDDFDEREIFKFMVIVLMTFLIIQWMSFEFAIAQFAVMAIGTALVRLMLLDFKPKTYDALTEKCIMPVKALIQFCGRKTLDIYVVHLLIFKAIALLLALEGYGLFAWTWRAV